MAKRKNVTMSDSLYRRVEESYALRDDPSLTATINRLIEEGLDAEQRDSEMSEMERRIGERIDRMEKAILGDRPRN